VTYGVHKFHKYHTLTSHFYISRPIFFHRDAFDAWPRELQQAMQQAVTDAVTFQRGLAEEEYVTSKAAIEAEGCVINALTPQEHDAFVAAVQPLRDEARAVYGDEMFRLVPKA
jgi:TRAP-type C4-dicarboxylate transport system substrate-binding protein